MENTTWVKLYRKFTEWEWYSDINTKVLFLHLLLRVNYKDKNWRGVLVRRGSIITSLGNLAEETGLTVMQVRTSVKKLISTHEITHLGTREYSVITIEKYNEYQTDNKPSNTQVTNEQQTSNTPVTTTKECKERKNISKDTATPVYGNKDLISLKKFLMSNYPKPLDGVVDTRKLQNLKQVSTKRKNQDEWMDEDWKQNIKKFLILYLQETQEEYLVNSIDKLREKAKLWREYRGKIN